MSCSGEEEIRLGGPAAKCGGQSRLTRWRAAWKRLMSRIFGRRRQQNRGCYDEQSYAQNFDEGKLWDEEEPDNLGRSFSMRFADPSRVRLLKDEVELLDF